MFSNTVEEIASLSYPQKVIEIMAGHPADMMPLLVGWQAMLKGSYNLRHLCFVPCENIAGLSIFGEHKKINQLSYNVELAESCISANSRNKRKTSLRHLHSTREPEFVGILLVELFAK